MAIDLRIVMILLFVGVGVGLSAQAEVETISYDDMVRSVASKKNPYPDPTDNLFIAYPNPTIDEQFSIEMNRNYQGTLLIQIYDMLGRLYYSKIVNKSYKSLEYDINASGWASGMYVVAITGDGFRGSQRVMKE